jgi:hypothetical protein
VYGTSLRRRQGKPRHAKKVDETIKVRLRIHAQIVVNGGQYLSGPQRILPGPVIFAVSTRFYEFGVFVNRLLKVPGYQSIGTLYTLERDNAIDRIPEDADDASVGEELGDALTRFRRREVSGSNFSDVLPIPRGRKMCQVPVQTTMEMRVEKSGLLGRDWKDRVLPQYLVQPTRAGARRSDDKKRGKRFERAPASLLVAVAI